MIPALTPVEAEAAEAFIRRVLAEVPARLVQASLFGSMARGDARPDSDLDILLVFHALPPDREPHASQAEGIADEVARATGVPVTVWSVSLVDLERGNRTPMLVDALEDSRPLWWESHPLPPLPFTPEDALSCAAALLDRVDEGSEEFGYWLDEGRVEEAARRARDDVVRMCTASLLLRGITRPRRGEAVLTFRALLDGSPLPAGAEAVLEWAAGSFGPHGRDEESPVPPPPGGWGGVSRTVEMLRHLVIEEGRELAGRVEEAEASGLQVVPRYRGAPSPQARDEL